MKKIIMAVSKVVNASGEEEWSTERRETGDRACEAERERVLVSFEFCFFVRLTPASVIIQEGGLA